MKFKIRAATVADCELATPLIYDSGPEIFDYIFGEKETAKDFIRFAFSDGPGFLGHRNHLMITLEDDTTVGIGAFYSAKEYIFLTLATIKQTFRYYPFLTTCNVLQKISKTTAIMPPPKRHEYYIAHLAVKEEYRNHGACSYLLKTQFNVATLKGQRRCVLDVMSENTNAKWLYSNLGFEEVGHSKLNSPNGLLATFRMSLTL